MDQAACVWDDVLTLAAVLPAGLPWWAGVGALVVLLYTAIVDARTGLVPPWPLAVGILVAVVGWLTVEPAHAAPAILAGFWFYCAIWALNMAWALITKHDALGMGDGHWSILAVITYGWPLTIAAWGVGAILAIAFLWLRQLMRKPVGHVHFAPFLLAGLIGARLTLG